MQDGKNSKEFDLSFLIRVGLKFWYLILLGAVIFGAIGGVFKTVTVKPTYTSTVSFWVSADGDNSSNILGAAQIATGYVELINKGPKALWDRTNTYENTKNPSKPTLSDKWGMSINDTYATLDAMVSASKTYDESFMFTVRVTSGSRERTFDAIFSLQYVTEEVLASISGNSNVVRVSEIFDTSDISVSSSSALKYAVVSALIGAVLAYLACFVFYLYRRKIESAEHLSESCELAVLASVNMRQADKNSEEVTVGICEETVRQVSLLRTELDNLTGGAKVYGVIPSSPTVSAEFISLCLAESFGNIGSKTLLVCPADMSDAKGLTVMKPEEDGKDAATGRVGLALSNKEAYDRVIVALPSIYDILDLGSSVPLLDAVMVVTAKGERIERITETVSSLNKVGIGAVGACYIE